MKNIILKPFFVLIAYFLLIPDAFAQISIPLPGDPFGLTPGIDPAISQHTDAKAMIIMILNFFIGFVGTIALVMFVLGGFWYLTAGGKDEQVEKGKKTLLYAVIGVIVVSISYAAVYTLTSEAIGGYTGTDGSWSGLMNSLMDYL